VKIQNLVAIDTHVHVESEVANNAAGDAARKVDYQVWCGPAMGAFNEWTKGSFLERPENRRVATVALNLLYGAAVLIRVNFAKSQGVRLPSGFPSVAPLELVTLRAVK